MLLRIAQKEILLHVRESRFLWVAGLFCGLVVLGTALMSRDYARRLETYHTSLSAERRETFAVDGSQSIPRQVRALVNDRGIFAFRRPQELAPLASGLESATPTQIHVSDTRSWSRQANESNYQNPLLGLFPRPDFSYVVASILSLVALFFTFDAVCGEKWSGTLRLMMSTAVSRDRVLVGKWIGSMVTLGIPFVLAILLGMVLLIVIGGVTPSGPTLARMAGIAGLGLLYLSLFVTIGLAVSVLARRPSSSLLICLTLWVASTLVLPNLLASVGRRLRPAQSYQQMQKRGIDREVREEYARLRRENREKKISDEERQRLGRLGWEEGEAEKGRIAEAYLRSTGAQVTVSQALSRASPAACLTYAASELADTGLGYYQRAQAAYAQYRRDFREYARRLRREADEEKLQSDWLQAEEIPALTIRSSTLGETVDAIATEVIVLALVQVLAFAVAYVGFLRYDVR
ncbi:MAG: ABC transporter permease subunit [Candidatus Latescibacteria bacterium]|jgi:hypothetical protein|nr:ABC transporter permease subunit [Candidatus Latescibacterota bacterium]